jgi:hypothetical protein
LAAAQPSVPCSPTSSPWRAGRAEITEVCRLRPAWWARATSDAGNARNTAPANARNAAAQQSGDGRQDARAWRSEWDARRLLLSEGGLLAKLPEALLLPEARLLLEGGLLAKLPVVLLLSPILRAAASSLGLTAWATLTPLPEAATVTRTRAARGNGRTRSPGCGGGHPVAEDRRQRQAAAHYRHGHRGALPNENIHEGIP